MLKNKKISIEVNMGLVVLCILFLGVGIHSIFQKNKCLDDSKCVVQMKEKK